MAVSNPKTKRPAGRPMISREKRGYDAELAHLSRIRSACIADSRLKTSEYERIVLAIQTIEKELRRMPKSKMRMPKSKMRGARS
jgi:hypothetical protein